MPGFLTLIQGPAGSGKSQEVSRLVRENPDTVLADLTALWAALKAVERQPDGRFPRRTAEDVAIASGLAAYIRRAVVRQGLREGLDVIVTSGTPAAAVYAEIARELDAVFAVQTIDPGREIVESRLRNPDTGFLDEECQNAINRWYR